MKNPKRVREGKRKQEVKRNSQEHEAVVRVQREKIQSGRKKDKKFESEGGGASDALAEEDQIEQWRYTSWRSPRRKSHCW